MKVGSKIPALRALAACMLFGIATAQDRGQEPDPKPLADVKANGQPQLVSFARGGRTGTYWVRIPAKAKKETASRAVLWFHGARGSGFEHQQALAALGLGKTEILICPNGSTRNAAYSYDHGRDPAPLLAALDDVAAAWKLGPVLVGGHSAGAFATHAVFGAAPERFAGVLPCCGGVGGMTTVKSLLEKLGKLAPPICVVHGESDPIVDGSSDDRYYESLIEAAWPAVRYVHPPDLDHDLAKAPLKECFEWLFALSSDKPAELLAFAKQAAAGERPRDATYALDRAEHFKATPAQTAAIRKAAATKATQLGKEWAKRIETGTTRAEALLRFYDARAGLLGFEEARSAFDALAKLQAEQLEPAATALRAAQESKSAADFQAILERFPAAYPSVRAANAWLRKGPKK